MSKDLNQKIYVAGHRGMVGSAIVRNLQTKGFTNIVTRTHAQMDLTDQAAVKTFFEEEKPDQEEAIAKPVEAPKQSITPMAGALEAFNHDEKDLLARIAEEVTELIQLEEIRLAHERCEMLENDEKVALWSLLDSKTRSALKKYKNAIKWTIFKT